MENGGELIDFASCGEVIVGLVGFDGARERPGVRAKELGGPEDMPCYSNIVRSS